MKKPLCVFALGVFAVVSLASPPSALRKKILAIDKQVASAIMKRDMAAFSAALKPNVSLNFRYFEPHAGKPMTFDQMVAQMGLTMFTKITAANATLVSLKEQANSATAVSKHHIEATLEDSHKKTHKFVADSQSTETYTKIGSDWKLSKMEMTSTKMSTDGKPFDPGQAQGDD